MHARMREVLLPLFAEHSVPAPLAIWETDDSPGTPLLTWMLKWQSLEVRNATWGAFRPVWEAAKRARKEPEFVTRTDLTLIEPWPGHVMAFPGAGSCEAAWVVQPQIGHGAEFRRICCDPELQAFDHASTSQIVASDFMFGPLPQSLLLLSWVSTAARREGMERIRNALADPSHPLANHILSPGQWSPLSRAPYLTTWALRH
jgi:hypothetical protein